MCRTQVISVTYTFSGDVRARSGGGQPVRRQRVRESVAAERAAAQHVAGARQVQYL